MKFFKNDFALYYLFGKNDVVVTSVYLPDVSGYAEQIINEASLEQGKEQKKQKVKTLKPTK